MDLKRLAVCLSLGQELYGSEAFGRVSVVRTGCMDLKRLAVCLSLGQELYGSEAFGRVSVVRTGAVWI